MIYERLWLELDKVAARYRRLRFWRALAVAWLLATLTALSLWAAGRSGGLTVTVPILCAIAGAWVAACVWMVMLSAPGHNWVARQIEAAFPDLGSCLMAAIEQRPDLPDGRFGFLQTSVIRQALTHSEIHGWQKVVPGRRIAAAVAVQFATFGLFLLALGGVAFWMTPSATAGSTGGNQRSASGGDAFAVTIEPGDTEIEKGSSLLVLARIQGDLPAEATLIFRPVTDDAAVETTRTTMSHSLNDPVFGARIASVQAPLDYHVELGTQTTKMFHVKVFEYPRLERADARLTYPRYTGMEERLVQDMRTVSVVEGTDVAITCWLNKPVARATFTESGAQPIDLSAVAGEKPAYLATIHADKTRRLKLELVDESGRKNVHQSELVINVVPDQPPTLKVVFPGRDTDVSPLEELDFKATVWDDFGVQRMGVSYSLTGHEPVDVVLGEKAAARQRHEMASTIRFEELKAEPDQLLTYYFWAEDFSPDGSIRRTMGDMYFAEVRHFDEIYRQGQQPPGGAQQQRQQQGQGANAQAAQQLGELQKEIINATWKLIRREIGSKLTNAFAEDVGHVAESQASALEQAGGLGERLRDEQSQEYIAKVVDSMQQAVTQLKSAREQPSRDPLKPALAAEEAAYQALLKLRAREHEVVRQQQQQGSASASARSQQQRQQMRQLDLNNEQNRYETQRQANSQPESEENRETRQVLNRLRELARRQHDLNEQLKDLQSALQEANTAEKRDELKRQLKRLQEEQQQILRDTDELQSRMETPENAERMSDERQQLEQTREQVRRASEAINQQMVTQAAASGTRAEQEFDELRNEFRRRASGGLADEMRDMVDTARELDRQQKELGERLTKSAQPDPKQKSLRDDNQREEIARELQQQRQRLSNLTERMRQTIQEAEKSEPLLSDKLYEVSRNAQDQNVDRILEATSRSLQQGLVNDAQQQEQAAERGITKLREGIEKAAETVLGDETDALRRAREELRNLSRQLNQEIDRNAPNSQRGQRGSGEQSADGQQPAGRGENGQEAEGDAARGQQSGASKRPAARGQRGQGQPGQQDQPGEGQPGQQPGEQQGQARGEGQRGEQQPGQGQRGQGQRGEQPGQGQRGQGQRGQGQPGEGQPGEGQPGEGQPGQQQGGQPGGQQAGQRNGRAGATTAGGGNPRGPQTGTGNFGPFVNGGDRPFAPIAGNDFIDWSDRLRDVEEMVTDPELRAEAARIRDRARSIRAETKRHSLPPNWDLVRVNVAEPLAELTDRVAEELLRRSSRQAVVPLDRDPVPPKYSEKTRRYYERLGSGK